MTGVGTSVLVWTVPTFGRVRRGFELLAGGTAVLLLLGGWAALRGPVDRVLVDDPASAVAPVGTLVARGVLRRGEHGAAAARFLGDVAAEERLRATVLHEHGGVLLATLR